MTDHDILLTLFSTKGCKAMNLQHIIKIGRRIETIKKVYPGSIHLECGAVVFPKRKTVVFRNPITGKYTSLEVKV